MVPVAIKARRSESPVDTKARKDHGRRYVPALDYGWLTPFYDVTMRLIMREGKFKRRLVEQAQITRGQRILDLGCGTATLTIMIAKMHPETEVIGVDGDPRILAIAQSKADRTGSKITLEQAMAFELPYTDSSFDRVLCSLLLHHLTRENKTRTLREVFRVLKPDGELHVADFGVPRNTVMRLITLVVGLLEDTRDNIKGLLPVMMRGAGFGMVEETTQFVTVFGPVSLYRAQRTSEGAGMRSAQT